MPRDPVTPDSKRALATVWTARRPGFWIERPVWDLMFMAARTTHNCYGHMWRPSFHCAADLIPDTISGGYEESEYGLTVEALEQAITW